MQLKDTQLFRQQAYIDGTWLDADSGQTLAVNNPATNEIIGTVPMISLVAGLLTLMVWPLSASSQVPSI